MNAATAQDLAASQLKLEAFEAVKNADAHVEIAEKLLQKCHAKGAFNPSPFVIELGMVRGEIINAKEDLLGDDLVEGCARASLCLKLAQNAEVRCAKQLAAMIRASRAA